jgi:hypothetical protein
VSLDDDAGTDLCGEAVGWAVGEVTGSDEAEETGVLVGSGSAEPKLAECVLESSASTSFRLSVRTLPPSTAPRTQTTVLRPTTVETAATATQPRT